MNLINRIQRQLKGWRTWALNILAGAPFGIEVALEILGSAEFGAIIPVEYYPYYALAVMLMNMWLRKITDTPLGRSE